MCVWPTHWTGFNSCFCCKDIALLPSRSHLQFTYAYSSDYLMRERICMCVSLCNRYVSPPSAACNGVLCLLCLYFYCECGAKKPTHCPAESGGRARARQVAILNVFHLFMLLCCARCEDAALHITQVAKFIAFYCAFR